MTTSWASNSWAWAAWSNNTWGGWTVEYEYKTELQDGAPDRGGRSRGGRTVRSRYADDVFAIDRVPAKYEVRPANWRAPWQRDEDVSIKHTRPADVYTNPEKVDTSPTPTPASATAPTTVTVTQEALLSAGKQVTQLVADAKQAAAELQRSQSEALAVAMALLLLDDDSY